MAYIVMAYIGTASKVMTCIGMVYMGLAYVVSTHVPPSPFYPSAV